MKRILIVSPIPFNPATSGNRQRLRRLIEAQQARGFEVHFLYSRTFCNFGDSRRMNQFLNGRFYACGWFSLRRLFKGQIDRMLAKILGPVFRRYVVELGNRLISRTVRHLPRSGGIDSYFPKSLERGILRLKSQYTFDAVMVEYVIFSRAFEHFDSSTLRILDTQDVFSDRHKQFVERGLKPSWFSLDPGEEAKGLNRADIVLAIQENEARFFKSVCTKKVVTIGHVVDITNPSPGEVERPVRNLLFMGSCSAANQHGISWFIENILPRIRRVDSCLCLLVGGEVCRFVEDIEGCVKLGVVDDLKEIYARADVVVNPVFIGTGLKIKTIEALGHGKPVIASPAGAAGLEKWAGSSFLVAESSDEFCDKIINVVQDQRLRSGLSLEALRCVEEVNAAVSRATDDVFGEQFVN